MIWQILAALAIGIVVGASGIAPAALSSSLDTLLTVVLCLLLFVIGIDLSQNGNIIRRSGVPASGWCWSRC